MRGFRSGRRFRAARRWSNDVLRKVAPIFSGDVVNVSGWHDEDKEGGHYRNYFSSAHSYRVTNYGGYRGHVAGDQIELDLERELPDALLGSADVVFNHTTLEHVFDVFKAVSNLCLMTRDVLIVVVPAAQQEHPSESFGDYWRFMSGGLQRLIEVNRLTPLVLTSSPYRDCAVYHLCIASRHPANWSGMMPVLPPVNDGSDLFRENIVERVVNRWRNRGSTE